MVAMFVCLSQGIGDSMKAQKTDLRTADGLVVYDLDPQASELWTVAGPDNVDPATIDIDDLPAGFRVVTEYEWESLQDDDEQDDEPPMPTIMICNCDEWVRENCGVDFDGLDDETVRELVDLLTQDLSELLDCFKFKVEFPTDGKTTYHGWNGFRGFKHRFGICGTFDGLTDEQFDKVGELIQKSQDMIEHHVDRIRRRSYAFKTDSESGTICANSFAEACDKLREKLPESVVDDGGWGWIVDAGVQRFVIGDVP